MSDRQKCFCIIPARGGSKRVPRKNVLPLNGIPLISYSIRAAKDSGRFDKVIVSTEDQEIADVAIAEGVEVDDRPEKMAGDKVTKVQVVKEYIERTEADKEYDYVAALLPTCPFRTAGDIKNAVDRLLSSNNHDFLIGVVEYDFPIQLALAIDDTNTASMVFPGGYNTTRSQDIQKRFHPNGAIYMARTKRFMEHGTFFHDPMLAYEMPAIRSFDIDYPYQFAMAEIIAKQIKENDGEFV